MVGKLVIDAFIMLYDTVVQKRRAGYGSKLFDLAEWSVRIWCFINEAEMERKFDLKTREVDGIALEDMEWAKTLMERDNTVRNEIEHFSVKTALIEHPWQRYGQAKNK